MSAEPEWLLEPVVLAIRRALIAEHGGAEGIRDSGPEALATLVVQAPAT